jgi:hypothetical protein
MIEFELARRVRKLWCQGSRPGRMCNWEVLLKLELKWVVHILAENYVGSTQTDTRYPQVKKYSGHSLCSNSSLNCFKCNIIVLGSYRVHLLTSSVAFLPPMHEYSWETKVLFYLQVPIWLEESHMHLRKSQIKSSYWSWPNDSINLSSDKGGTTRKSICSTCNLLSYSFSAS